MCSIQYADDREETGGDHVRRGVQVAAERPGGSLVGGEEQPVLAGEVAEHRALGDASLARDFLDPDAVITALGEMAHRHPHYLLLPRRLTGSCPDRHAVRGPRRRTCGETVQFDLWSFLDPDSIRVMPLT